MWWHVVIAAFIGTLLALASIIVSNKLNKMLKDKKKKEKDEIAY